MGGFHVLVWAKALVYSPDCSRTYHVTQARLHLILRQFFCCVQSYSLIIWDLVVLLWISVLSLVMSVTLQVLIFLGESSALIIEAFRGCWGFYGTLSMPIISNFLVLIFTYMDVPGCVCMNHVGIGARRCQKRWAEPWSWNHRELLATQWGVLGLGSFAGVIHASNYWLVCLSSPPFLKLFENKKRIEHFVFMEDHHKQLLALLFWKCYVQLYLTIAFSSAFSWDGVSQFIAWIGLELSI